MPIPNRIKTMFRQGSHAPETTHIIGCNLNEVTLPDRDLFITENLIMQAYHLKNQHKLPSLLIMGPPGVGKSRATLPFLKEKRVSYVNDITPKYLRDFLIKVRDGQKDLLVIPDFIPCLSHSKATQSTLLSILRSMTEEGVIDLSDYQLEFKADYRVKAGLVTALTFEKYQEFKRQWKTTGFLSRLVPFTYTHSPETQEKILKTIINNEPDQIEKYRFKINRNPPQVTIEPQFLSQLTVLAKMLGEEAGSMPYRQQIQLDILAEASAILRGDNKVTQQDIDLISRLSHWINYDFNAI